jgi:hypothetical protein
MAKHLSEAALLNRQCEFLKKRARDIIQRGLKTIDKLDKVEEKEKQEKETERTAAAAMQLNQLTVDPFDLFAGLDVLLLLLKV